MPCSIRCCPSGTSKTHAANEAPACSLAFHIGRTPSANLPVYRSVRAGGTRVVTRIQRVTGDASALCSSLVRNAGIPAERVAVRPHSGNVECNGDYTEAVRQHLLRLGF